NSASLRELTALVPWYKRPLIGAARALPLLKITGASHTPAVESLAPFEVDERALPEAVRQRLAPLTAELAALGFHSPIFYAIEDKRQSTRIYRAVFLHSGGRAVAGVQYMIWVNMGKEITFLAPAFCSLLDNGSFLVTRVGKPGPMLPENVHVACRSDAGTAELWEGHQQELTAILYRKPALVADHDALRSVVERTHASSRDVWLARGIFRPGEDGGEEPVAVEAGDEALHVDDTDVAVLREIDRLQKQRGNWWAALLTLAVSLAVFVAAGGKN